MGAARLWLVSDHDRLPMGKVELPPTPVVRRPRVWGFIVFVLVAILLLQERALGALFYGALFFVLGRFGMAHLRFARLRGHLVEQQGTQLIEYDASGRRIARVALDQPYQAGFSFVGNNWSICEVRQFGQKLRFHTRLDNAEELVKMLLGHESWPPTFKMAWP